MKWWRRPTRFFRKKQYDKGWRCPKCFLERPFKGAPDMCLGYLPGVKYACCGHGDPHRYGEAYVFFTNGKIIRMYGEVSVEEHQSSE